MLTPFNFLSPKMVQTSILQVKVEARGRKLMPILGYLYVITTQEC